MDEFEIIERYFRRAGSDRPDVVVGIGDDAAITTLQDGYELVIATDSLVVDTHFPADTAARALGHRCLAVNLSDMAAMGAEPLWATLSLALPEAGPGWLEEFADGFMTLAKEHGVALIGGDLVRGPLAMTVTIHGRVEQGRYIGRAGAHSGDLIFVTGSVGDAAAGLRRMLDKETGGGAPADELIRRFLYPTPRVREGRRLVGIANAMIDISDGLQDDVCKMLGAGGVGALLDVSTVPISESLQQVAGSEAALKYALTGGDDYELCFAVPADMRASFTELTDRWECGVACIGEVTDSPDVRWMRDGKRFDPPDGGYRHF